jgi:hypothetical protein
MHRKFTKAPAGRHSFDPPRRTPSMNYSNPLRIDIHRVHIDIQLPNVLCYRMSRKHPPSLPNLPPARPDHRSSARHKSSTNTCKNFPLSDLFIVEDLKSTRINTSKISKIPRILFPAIDFNPTKINTSGNKHLKSPRINTSGHKDLKSNHFNTSKKHGRGCGKASGEFIAQPSCRNGAHKPRALETIRAAFMRARRALC